MTEHRRPPLSFSFPLVFPELTGFLLLLKGGKGGFEGSGSFSFRDDRRAHVHIPIQEQYMSKRAPGPKNKVNRERPDIIPDRECVDFLLHYFGYPALLSLKAFESLIHRERKAREKQGHSCQI